MPSGAVGMTLHFTTSVKTPKGSKSANGTIVIKQTAPQKLAMTVSASDGTTATINLLVSNGSVQPDPSQTPPSGGDSQSTAAAKALLPNMKLAASIGVAAKKSDGASFAVPVTLTPVGEGTPMPAQLQMAAQKGASGSVAFSGSISAHTNTVLPQSGGLDPEQLVKTAGVAVVAHGFTPAGRLATAAVMHRRQEQQKQAMNGPQPDAMVLDVTSHFANGRFHDISGTQTDTLSISGHSVTITSNWSFTAAK